MQLLSIENLCLAAEATAVLLLLAFAWPESKKTPTTNDRDTEPVDWEPAKHYFLKATVFRGLYLKQCSLDTASPAVPFPSQTADDIETPESLPLPWQDRLTKCLNRNGFDSILGAWLSLASEHRESSCVSLIILNEYSKMISDHGAMVTEQALQNVAKQLQKDAGGNSVVARYLPDRFAVLHFASSLPACCNSMALSQYRIAEPGFFSSAGSPVSIGCLISIAGLGGDFDLETRVEELEQGGVEAENSGRRVIARVDHGWTDSLVNFDPSEIQKRDASHAEQTDSATLSNDIAQNNDAASMEASRPASEPESTQLNTDATSDPANSDDEASSSSDISAVANPDDIAALFSQINSNKSSKSAEKAAAVQDSATTIPTDTASADDIAALFNSAKANGDTTQGDTPKSPTPSVSQSTNAEELGQAASADDIASLFAAAKTSPAAQPAAAQPKVNVDPSESASADDIASLFATMKPTATAVPPSPLPTDPPAKQVDAPKKVEEPKANEDLSGNASADDIASLFAAAKPQAKTTSATQPAPTNAVPAPVEDLSGNASADDIASLFAATKPQTKSIAATQPPPAVAVAAPVEDLSGNASADDIASLFAAAKPQAKTTTDSPLAPVVAAPAPVEDLSGNASADDIASLFAAAKPVAIPTSNTPIATPTPDEVPKAVEAPDQIEELSGNASADDIASLFASVKPSMKKPNAPATSTSVNAPHPTASTNSQQGLSEAATSDDIASLFASVKTGIKQEDIPQSSRTTDAPASKLPIAEQELGEIATADDIAMLFQTVHQVNKTAKASEDAPAKAVATNTTNKPASVVPPEDLSSNASLDDIEALFAAMKK